MPPRLLLPLLSAFVLLRVPDGRAAEEDFLVSVHADAARTVSCVEGGAGDALGFVVSAQLPEDRGAIYVTLRFDFPENIRLVGRPVLPPNAVDVIVTEFVDGVEWNVFFIDCPTGWFEVVRQDFEVLDRTPTRIAVEHAHSLVRDCDLVLHDVRPGDVLGINDPRCGGVSTQRSSWSSLKWRQGRRTP